MHEHKDVVAVVLWPSSVQPKELPTSWVVVGVNELIWPSYQVVTRDGYDPKAGYKSAMKLERSEKQ